MSKQYGLILPNKNKQTLTKPVSNEIKRPSIFDEDSDSDSAPKINKPTGISKNLKKQDKITQEKAVEEDPTVYQYDEIYDEMDQKRQQSKLSRKDLDKKPKYISKLLAAAGRRKQENERRIEREVQKEREAEGEQFKDKEAFVTSAYRAKLEEMKLLEEQEKREEYLESIGDVTKQGNLDGFYRHLYDQKVNYEETNTEKSNENLIKTEPNIENSSEQTKQSSSNESSNEDTSDVKLKQKKLSKLRNFRKRDHSNSDNENSDLEIKKEHLPSNLDADSDFSMDSSDSEDDDEDGSKNKKEEIGSENKIENVDVTKSNDDKENSTIVVKNQIKLEETIEPPKQKKPKVDIWKKRTVGEVFDAALQRYFERKALREAGN